jgi:lipopolysaccharide export system protein LptA
VPILYDKKPRAYQIHLLRIIALAAVVLYAAAATAAGQSDTKATAGQPQDEPIQITADQLISNNEEQYADFIGNVKVVQADWVITSDKLRIYYKGNLLNPEEKSDSTEQSLRKIVATGHVAIRSEQYSADAEKAEYDTAAETIVLSGEDSKLFKGKNSITGSKITLYQKEGRVEVEGSKNKRIKAVFYSEGKPSNAFKMEKPKQ